MEGRGKLFNLNVLSKLIFLFWIYICFSPTIRILMIGGRQYTNLYQLFITAIPDIMLFIIVAFAFMVWLKGSRFKFVVFDWILLGYIGFNVIYGFILSGDVFISAQGFRTTYLVTIFYFIGRMYVNTDRTAIEKLLTNIFSWYAVYSVLGILFHFIFPGYEKQLIQESMHIESQYFIVRMGAFLLTPVLFGTFASMGCVYFYYKVITSNAPSWKHYLLIAILWTAVFLSVSRGPILTFLIAFVLLTLLSRKWKPALLTLLIVLGISFALSYILIGTAYPLKWFFSSTTDTLDMGQGVTRVNLWRKSIQDFDKNIGGYGLGHSGEVAFRYLKKGSIPAAIYTTDGWYLKLACETGIYGLLFYVLMSLYYFIKGAKFILKNNVTFFSFAFAVFFMVNAQNVVENVLDYYPYIFLYWLIIGFSVNTAFANTGIKQTTVT